MDNYEDDDDTHFCIKCHVTITGLENYVRHRQSECRPVEVKVDEVVQEEPPSTPTTVTYPEILNADAFFSSLELQSSSKTNQRRATPSLENDRKRKKDDRRNRRVRKSQTNDSEESTTTKEKIHSLSPVVTEDLDNPTEHLSIPSLVGFPDIVSSSSTKVTTTPARISIPTTTNKINQPGPSRISAVPFPKADTSLASLMDGKQTSEVKRQDDSHRNWLEDTIILADLENKELNRYQFDYQQDEEEEDGDSDDDILIDDLIEEVSDYESEEAEDQERPPRGHTGGKWKPGLEDMHRNLQQIHHDYEDVDQDDDHHHHQGHPPPSYTGGKWKPTETTQKIEEYETKHSSRQPLPTPSSPPPQPSSPPPGHTRGKWIPGAQADIDSGYWCNPCGRKLASRLVYNRHLLSDLHAKRSIRELDGNLDLPRGSVHSFLLRKTARRRILMKKEQSSKNNKPGIKTRKREKEVIVCEMCHVRVKRGQIGKHLLSHYHCRVAGINPRSPEARKFVLENMGNVVRQCPFQCSSCRFYCNTEDTFLLHWRSDLHARTVAQKGDSFQCASCDFWCDDNESMESHLSSPNHRNVVFMMNRSVPVVISRQTALLCSICDRRFRYNLQLRLHAKSTSHVQSSTASNRYQKRITCNLCPQVFRSLVSLQRHQLSCHFGKTSEKTESNDSTTKEESPQIYFCSFCSMNFTSVQEAIRHRRTSSHKETVKASKHDEGPTKSLIRECPHCNAKQSNIVDHKQHLLENHSELCHRCPRCGMLFALSQELAWHTREKKCCNPESQSDSNKSSSCLKDRWKCSSCTFSADTQAEFLFHKVLHTVGKGTPRGDKYPCPLCEKTFNKVTLRDHLRCHTKERPFHCIKCNLSFSRRSKLSAHQKEYACSSEWIDKTPRQRSFICSECDGAFYTKHALRQHMLRHAGKRYKCGLPGCPTILRTSSELKSHKKLVHDGTASDRKFPCDDCSYSAKNKTQLRRHRMKHEKTLDSDKLDYQACLYNGCGFKTRLSSHLRRHVRLHTGVKPYKCRHCTYASNNLENLRKHVLSTNLHPNKKIYECEFCTTTDAAIPFETNFSKELRAHLLDVHATIFSTPIHARNYINAIFESDSKTSV